ncbi:extracellular solute-binding protein [Cohnella silvisoli]|uniref:Extracellular solute-binding protein n=1 Tax=Cohnella silvisoli TaxID=2873699 RepID=A0ABV1L2L5_9BACL|nr:extracellular solute-binding protein [Cohnella silvisoli]MCD9021607.1 extracellular solute-binding protein [Cohnella silvisoli]
MIRYRSILPLIVFLAIGLFVLCWIIWAQNNKPPLLAPANEDQQIMPLNLFINAPMDTILPEENTDFIRQIIEKKFNVRIHVTAMVPGNEYNAKIESLLFANNPPDMWIDRSNDGASKLSLDGVLADMSSYVSQLTMPNYFKYWVTEKELKQYQIHNRFYRAPIPYDKNSYRSYYIRQDWLKHLGLEIPRNYNEYMQVLRAFTFDDPDGNGKKDTYGFTTSGNNSSLSTDWPEYAKNGLVYPAYMNNNELVDMESDLRVEHVVDDILKVINEGLVDPDWFFNSGTEHVDKAIQGKAGVVLGQTVDFALDANPASIQSLSRKQDPNANWVPFNPLGNQPLRAGGSPEYPFVFAKMTADKHPERIKKIVEILDWLSSEEGFLLTHYGIEGEHYSRRGNTITLLPQETDNPNHSFNSLKLWSFFTPETPSVLGMQVVDPKMTARDVDIKAFLGQLPVKPKLGVALAPPLGIDVGAFRARQNELQVKMLFSDQSGKQWPVYYNEIMSQYNGFQIIKNFEKQVKSAASEAP